MHVKRIMAHNLFERNDVWCFDPLVAAQRGPMLPRLAGLKVICEDVRWPRSLEAMNAACAEQVKLLLFSSAARRQAYRVWLFVAYAFWEADSRIVRYRKLWKTMPRELVDCNFHLSPEVLFESKEGVRYAGVALVTSDRFLEATRMLLARDSFALIMSKREGMDTEPRIRELFEAAFPIGKHGNVGPVDWQHLAEKLCPLSDVVIKAGGHFDDREAYIDLILSPETMAALGWNPL